MGRLVAPSRSTVVATFGAVVTGVELRSVDGATFDELHETWLEFALLIFPGPSLRPLVKVHPETGRPC